MKPMRLEYKFRVAKENLNELREALHPFVFVDEYADREIAKEYTCRSIYYDTMKFNDYHDKLAGVKLRKKLRIRGYNQPNEHSVVFLEIKRKHENHISKNRAPLLYSNLDNLLADQDFEKYLLKKNNFFDMQKDASSFFYFYKLKFYSPVVLVTYDREAYYSKHDSTLRITFDKNLRSFPLPETSDIFEDDRLKPAMLKEIILEIKFFSGFPQWLQKILQRFELKREAISKYVISVDNQPELDRLKISKNILVPKKYGSYRNSSWKEVVKNVG
jgi:hypothetical protein